MGSHTSTNLTPQTWVSSWYGLPFHGRRTANGTLFDRWAATCAHRDLPFGTRLKLTNPENKKALVVRVTDRGPYIKGRDLDVSEGVAYKLGFHEKGVTRLLVEMLGEKSERKILAQPPKAAKLNIQPAPSGSF